MSEYSYLTTYDKEDRHSIFPLKHLDLWKLYKVQQHSHWIAEEIDFTTDHDDYLKLTPDEQLFLKHVLAFFAEADGIVNMNITNKFLHEVPILEAQFIYNYQVMMEQVHNETYSLMIDRIINNDKEAHDLYNASSVNPAIKSIKEWAYYWSNSDAPFPVRLIMFAIMEGVFFAGGFACIYWFKSYKTGTNFLSGLVKSNEFIARDEGQHCTFAVHLFNNYIKKEHKPTQAYIEKIFNESLDVIDKFVSMALPTVLIGIDATQMSLYYKYIADILITSLGYTSVYNVSNPLIFMDKLGINIRSNFFESRPTEYQAAANTDALDTSTMLADF